MSESRIGEQREVVITGVGLVTPLGWGTDTTWNNLLAGRSAAIWLDELDESRAAGPRWAGMPVPGVSLREPLRLRRFVMSAAEEAVADSQLDFARDVAPERVGCVVGVSKSDLTAYSAWAQSCATQLDVADSNLIDAALCPNDPSVQLARRFNIRGAALCPMAACATGLMSILRGVQLIQDGTCDVVLAGSVDASLTPALLGCYSRMKVLASGFEDPQRAMQPFDVRRNGFLVGEGAGMLLLESSDFASRRGGRPIARVLGYAQGNDPTGMTDIDTTGATLARVIRDALHRSGVEPRDVDAVQVHGTATRQNDLCESQALRCVWGDRLPPAVASVKGAIGHLLGGAGSVETAFAVLSLRDQTLPPATGLEQLDPECRVDVSPQQRTMSLRRVLKLSLGFGGHLAVLLLDRCDSAGPHPLASARNRVVEDPDPRT